MAKRTCSIARCPEPHEAHGWCVTHYRRWQKTGDPQADVPVKRHVAAGTKCVIPDCTGEFYAREWCSTHYERWRATGDPLGSKPRRGRAGIYPPGSKSPHEWISCKGCGKDVLVRMGGQGYCSKACSSKDRTRDAHPLWRGDEAGYVSMHKRVRRARGKAFGCTQCGLRDPAGYYEWANLTGRYEDIWDYTSMCKACHVVYDIALLPRGEANGNAKLTEESVREIRARAARGVTAYAMRNDYGVCAVTLRHVIAGHTWKHVAPEVLSAGTRDN
jgi:hypothetical protein